MLIKMFCFHMLPELATLHRLLISESGEKWFRTGLSTVFSFPYHYLSPALFIFFYLAIYLTHRGNFPLQFFHKSPSLHHLKSYEEANCATHMVMNDLSRQQQTQRWNCYNTQILESLSDSKHFQDFSKAISTILVILISCQHVTKVH